jgi:hypothetical protein
MTRRIVALVGLIVALALLSLIPAPTAAEPINLQLPTLGTD